MKIYFRKKLLEWNSKHNKREMPWKGIANPYHIWLSEIILQQTRVEQGWAYYERFIKTFPKIENLAAAPEDQVMKLWEGLGYYSRARNLLTAAKYVVNDLEGNFPASYDELLKLKGVGPYTAAAIASFAYNLPHAVVDGNVFRVLSRFFNIELPIDSTTGKKHFTTLANELIHPKKAGKYNQAIMDFGATICKPAPDCDRCPLSRKCASKAEGNISSRPVKEKKLVKKTRYFYFFISVKDDCIYLEKRVKKDIWLHLYQLPLVESKKVLSLKSLRQNFPSIGIDKEVQILDVSEEKRHILTHQNIKARFVRLEGQAGDSLQDHGFLKVPLAELNNYAFPKLIDCYFLDNPIYLVKAQNRKYQT